MDLLAEEWLASTVAKELGEVLRSRLENPDTDIGNGTAGNIEYEDDGSNLKVKSQKPGVLQISKWLIRVPPIKVTLSDAHTRINAFITESASDAYEKLARRPVTEGTIGGMMQILDFEIVATHSGPRADRLTLLVKDFKMLGSEGSGQYGMAPRPIELVDHEKFKLQIKLKELRDIQKERSQASAVAQGSVQARSFQSQTGSTSELELGGSSQPVFATQVPYSTESTTSTKNIAPHGALAIESTNFELHQPIIPSYSADSARTNQEQNVRPFAPPESKPSPVKKPTGPEKGLLRFAAKQQGKKSRQDLSADMTDPDLNRAQAAGVNYLDHASRSASRVASLPPEPGADMHVPSSIQTTNGHPQEQSTTPIVPPVDPAVVAANAGLSIEKTALAPMLPSPKQSKPLSNQRKVRDPISSRDVRIPKDQEALLNRLDSWLPAEPGQRDPYANVPMPTLQSFNKKADDRATLQSSRGQDHRDVHAPPRSKPESTQDSESDRPLSSAQWPSSPVRDALPPDSSVPSAGHSDPDTTLQNKRILPDQSRRPSNASVSSQLVASTKMKSRPSQIPSISSLESDLSLGSPSIISNSAGEEVQHWRCHPCDKSYTNPGGLKYHNNRYHKNDSSPIKTFDCPKKGCKQSYRAKSGLKNHIDLHHRGAKSSWGHKQSSASRSSKSGQSTPTFPNLKPYGSYGEDLQPPSKKRRVNGQASDDHPLPGKSVQELFTPQTHDQAEQRLDSLAEPISLGLTTNQEDDDLAPQSTTRAHKGKSQDRTIIDKASSPLESDLEMTVPLPLGEAKASDINSAPMQRSPSTASQSEEPFTQVKQTPYGNEYKLPVASQDRFMSPSRHIAPSSLDTSVANTTHVSLSDPAAPEIASTAPKNSEEIALGSQTQQIAQEPMNSQLIQDTSERDGVSDVPGLTAAQTSHHTATFIEPKSIDRPHQGPRPNMPPSQSTDHGEMDDQFQIEKRHPAKRKAIDSNLSSRKSVKRPKFLLEFLPQQDAPDPHMLARRNRHEFFSRRSSESSTPRESPISPPKGRRGTVAFGSFPSPKQTEKPSHLLEPDMPSETHTVETMDEVSLSHEKLAPSKPDCNEIVNPASAPQITEVPKPIEGTINDTIDDVVAKAPTLNTVDVLDHLDVGAGAQEDAIEHAAPPSNDGYDGVNSVSLTQDLQPRSDDYQNQYPPVLDTLDECEASSTAQTHNIAENPSKIGSDQTELQSSRDHQDSPVDHDSEAEAGAAIPGLANPTERDTTPPYSSHKRADHNIEIEVQALPARSSSDTSGVLALGNQNFELPISSVFQPKEGLGAEDIEVSSQRDDVSLHDASTSVQTNQPSHSQSLVARDVGVEAVIQPSSDASLAPHPVEGSDFRESNMRDSHLTNESTANSSPADPSHPDVPAGLTESLNANASTEAEENSHDLLEKYKKSERSQNVMSAEVPPHDILETLERSHHLKTSQPTGLASDTVPGSSIETEGTQETHSYEAQTAVEIFHDSVPESSDGDDSNRVQTLAGHSLEHSQSEQDGRSLTQSSDQIRAPGSTAAIIQDGTVDHKALMRKKQELAIKLREEEEKREEAAKKERSRQKMPLLGLEPTSDKRELAKKDLPTVPIEKENVEIGVDQDIARSLVQEHEAPASPSESPPKPPALAVSGVPVQYGLVQLHDASPGTTTQQVSPQSFEERQDKSAGADNGTSKLADQRFNRLSDSFEKDHSNGISPPASRIEAQNPEVPMENNKSKVPTPTELPSIDHVNKPKLTEEAALKPSQAIFNRFKTTYTDYAGDMKHFLTLCKKISKLLEADRMEHPSLWDDFIIRNKTDYCPYVISCAEEGDDAITYEKYYRQMIEDPKYNSRVVTTRNLSQILEIQTANLPFIPDNSFSRSVTSPYLWKDSIFSEEPRGKDISSLHSQQASVSTEQQSPRNISSSGHPKERIQIEETAIEDRSTLLRRNDSGSREDQRWTSRSSLSEISPSKGVPPLQQAKNSGRTAEQNPRKEPANGASQDVDSFTEAVTSKKAPVEQQPNRTDPGPRQASNSQQEKSSPKHVIDLTEDDDVTEVQDQSRSHHAPSNSQRHFSRYISNSSRRSLSRDELGSKSNGVADFAPHRSTNMSSQKSPRPKRTILETSHRSSLSSNASSRLKAKELLDNLERSAGSRLSSPSLVSDTKKAREESVELGHSDSDYSGSLRPSVRASRTALPTRATDTSDSQKGRESINGGVSKAQETRDLKESYTSSIRQNWGLGPGELLEPQFYTKESLPLKSLKVLSEISCILSAADAQVMVMDRIRKRTNTNPRLSLNSNQTLPSKITHSDIEQVKMIADARLIADNARQFTKPQATEQSSMRTSCPPDLSHTDAVVEMQDQEGPIEWWRDEDTPFKTFVRNYVSIQPGRCNSFASPTDIQFGQKVHRQSRGRMKKLDILGWHI